MRSLGQRRKFSHNYEAEQCQETYQSHKSNIDISRELMKILHDYQYNTGNSCHNTKQVSPLKLQSFSFDKNLSVCRKLVLWFFGFIH